MPLSLRSLVILGSALLFGAGCNSPSFDDVDAQGFSLGCGGLSPGEQLGNGQSVESCNKKVLFVMQSDGNLVAYYKPVMVPVWASNTSGGSRSFAAMQGDGNLVVYASDGRPVWASQSNGNPGAHLLIRDDSTLAVVAKDQRVLWASSHRAPAFAPCGLNAGEQLRPGQSVSSCAKTYTLTLQTDGNLVLYQRDGTPVWATYTTAAERKGALAVMQGDGNFVVYTNKGVPVWHSGTHGNGLSALAVENDGSLTVFARDHAILWNSGRPTGLGRLFSLTEAQQKSVFAQDTRIQMEGCNRVVYSQVPGSPSTFIGRSNNSGGCEGSGMLMRNRLTENGTFHAEGTLFDPRNTEWTEGRGIQSAYDPSVAIFAGRTWVAFECAGPGIVAAGTCAAPLDGSGTQIEREGLTVVVSGNAAGADPGFDHSASVPKLVVHRRHLYLYWSSVRLQNGAFVDIRTYGAELRVDGNKLRVVGTNGPLPANGGVEVWGLEGDGRSNRVADVFDVTSDGAYLYATAGLGGSECWNPLSVSAGCYRLAIGRTPDPLGTRTFNSLDPSRRIRDSVLPANAHEYSRVFSRANGRQAIVLASQPPPANTEGKTTIPAIGGLATFELPPAGTTCSADQPAPHWGMREGVCMLSCGALGGRTSSYASCERQGLTNVGPAWDVPFCCK